jgi:predicted esterase
VPSTIDMAHEWPVMIVSATSDAKYNSSRGLLQAYAEIALANGWILVAADPAEQITVEQDDVAMRLALNTAALALLGQQMPGARTAPLAFGGFSGGAKYSGWLAATFASQGRNIIGIYLAGINADTLVPAAKQLAVLNDKFKRTPVFLQSGRTDEIATPAAHATVFADLKRAGFRNVRVEYFDGGHEIDPRPMNEALQWFRQFTLVAAPAK